MSETRRFETFIEGERVPDPELDAWMRERGLLLEADKTCPVCHGDGWYWRIEGSPPARMFWHTCGECKSPSPGTSEKGTDNE